MFDNTSPDMTRWTPEKRAKFRKAPMSYGFFEDHLMPMLKTLRDRVVELQDGASGQKAIAAQKPRYRVPAAQQAKSYHNVDQSQYELMADGRTWRLKDEYR